MALHPRGAPLELWPEVAGVVRGGAQLAQEVDGAAARRGKRTGVGHRAALTDTSQTKRERERKREK